MVGSMVQVAVQPGQISPPQTCYPTACLNMPTRPRHLFFFIFTGFAETFNYLSRGKKITPVKVSLKKKQRIRGFGPYF